MNAQDENDSRLRQQLRREARRSRPAFSEALHARLVSAISAADMHGSPFAASRSRRFLRGQLLSWILAATAAIAMTFALALIWSGPRRSQGDAISHYADGGRIPGFGRKSKDISPQENAANTAARDFNAATEELARSASDVSEWVHAAADESQWAGLDRDAQAALAAVAGPLPFDLKFSVAQSSAP